MTEESRYVKEQELHSKQLSELTADVSSLSADVRTLMEGQKVVSSRLNRPTQWGVLVSAVALVAVILGLVTGPMKEDHRSLEAKVAMETERDIDLHIMFNNRLGDQIKVSTANETNIAWLMHLESRTNARLHGARQ